MCMFQIWQNAHDLSLELLLTAHLIEVKLKQIIVMSILCFTSWNTKLLSFYNMKLTDLLQLSKIIDITLEEHAEHKSFSSWFHKLTSNSGPTEAKVSLLMLNLQSWSPASFKRSCQSIKAAVRVWSQCLFRWHGWNVIDRWWLGRASVAIHCCICAK